MQTWYVILERTLTGWKMLISCASVVGAPLSRDRGPLHVSRDPLDREEPATTQPVSSTRFARTDLPRAHPAF